MPGRTPPSNDIRKGSYSAFNGGSGYCPAELAAAPLTASWVSALQWRAGLLPGRTPRLDSHSLVLAAPSMEGRAIARPNSLAGVHRRLRYRPFNGGPGYCPAEPGIGDEEGIRQCSFNGGPGYCPAEPPGIAAAAAILVVLQWRAGLLPGRTTPR